MVLYHPEEGESMQEASTRWWTAKHPGACPNCGGRDGMESYYQDELVSLDEWADDLRWYRLPGDDERRYTPCPYCHSGDTDGYIAIGYRDLLAWARGDDPMAPDHNALAREEPITQNADSRDAAF